MYRQQDPITRYLCLFQFITFQKGYHGITCSTMKVSSMHVMLCIKQCISKEVILGQFPVIIKRAGSPLSHTYN